MDYIDITVDVLNSTHRVRLRNDARCEEFITNIKQEFRDELQRESIPENADFALWLDNGVRSIGNKRIISKLGNNLRLVFGLRELAPNVPRRTFDIEMLRTISSRPLDQNVGVYLYEATTNQRLQVEWETQIIGRSGELDPHDRQIAGHIRRLTLDQRVFEPLRVDQVSRMHAALVKVNEHYFLAPLQQDQQKGTILNRQSSPLEFGYAEAIQTGDIISLGTSDISLIFRRT
jgi:hypothetical protein